MLPPPPPLTLFPKSERKCFAFAFVSVVVRIRIPPPPPQQNLKPILFLAHRDNLQGWIARKAPNSNSHLPFFPLEIMDFERTLLNISQLSAIARYIGTFGPAYIVTWPLFNFCSSVMQKHCALLYRVFHLLWYLGMVDMDFFCGWAAKQHGGTWKSKLS